MSLTNLQSCCICGLTHSFACLVCFVPHLYKGLFGLGRGQNTASVGLHSRDGHGGGGMLQIVTVTSRFLENTPLRASAFFSPLFPKLFFTRHTLTVWRMWNGMRARVAESFFCWLPALGFWLSLVSEHQASFTSPGFLAFFNIRIPGFVYLLVPEWKHFTPSLASIKWINCKMGKGSSKELN